MAGGYNAAAAADTATLAMDYRVVGFRECTSEVSRYLVSIEGLDLQDPLRLRLVSHLQCYSAQREASAKAACGGPAGTAPPPPPPPPPHPWTQHHQYAPPPTAGPSAGVMPMHNPAAAHHRPAMFDQSTAPGGAGSSSYLEALGRGPVVQPSQHVDGSMRLSSAVVVGGGGGCNSSQLNAASSPATGGTASQPSAAAASLLGVHHAAQFLGINSTMPMLSPNGLHYGSSAAAAAMLGQGVKPYRPWGAELAY